MQKLVLATLITLIGTSFVTAQTTHPAKSSAVFLGLNFDLGIPINDFKNQNDNIAAGGGFDLYFQPSVKIPVLIGFDLGFLNNGYKVQHQTLYADIVSGGTVIQTLSFPLRVETTNSISTGHLNLRLQSPTKFFKPYVEGVIGFNHFSTNTSIYDESEEYYLSQQDNPLITSANQNSDWTFSYGAAGGLLVEVGENILINARGSYTRGGAAEYYVKDDIDNWEIVFNTVPTSSTDASGDDIDISAVKKYRGRAANAAAAQLVQPRGLAGGARSRWPMAARTAVRQAARRVVR